jgi:argininosuccinate lyase
MKNNDDFIGSFSFDKRLAPYDIEGSIAHVKMLVKCGIIPSTDGNKIIAGLSAMLAKINKGVSLPRAEDVHFAVEQELIKKIGPVGGKMHTARSRNDQVALDIRLYLRAETYAVLELIKKLQLAISAAAKKNIDVVLPGYTHLQPAQPVLFSHHLLAYGAMFLRDSARLKDCLKRINVMPLGSAALAGTSFPIDRKYTAKLLGFDSVSENSMDAVSDRDFAIEFVSALSLISMHLSRLSEELVLWSSEEFGYIRLADEYTSGSSIMPQKRNPDCAEVVRGKTGRVYGDLFALLTIMKSLPLAYNRDMQEDKPPVFDAVDAVKACLEISAGMISSMKVNDVKMKAALGRGFLSATELADYLSRNGMPFRTAHGIVRDMVLFCADKEISLKDLTDTEMKKFSKLFTSEARRLADPSTAAAAKTSFGGTSQSSVKIQLKRFNEKILQN